MNTQRLCGFVFLVIGVILLWIGIHSSNSVVDQVNNTFTGRFTDATTWYIVGGIGLGLLGLLMGLISLRGKGV